jgi:hypothetical protein
VDAIGALEVRQRALDGQLGFAVAVDRILRMGFADRRLDRLAVGRARGRKNKVLHRLGGHRLEHTQRPSHVVAIVPRRFARGLADVQQRGEVHHRKNVVVPERLPHGDDIGDVALHELAEFRRRTMAGRETVVDDHAEPGLAQRLRRVAADVAGAAGDENGAAASVQWRNK